MDTAKVAQTFKRIGLSVDLRNIAPTFELLKKIQYAFVTTVPYENLDIIRRIPLQLTPEALFDKIVVRRRGGYCFELNCFYNWLLKELGYDTQNYFARYLRGENDIPMRRHRVVLAQSPMMDCGAVCDIGIGQRAPRLPLRLEQNTAQEQYGETYRFETDDFFGWVLCDFWDGAWGVFYAFTEEPQLDIDYVMPSFWCENSPDSPFIAKNMFSIKTDLGRKTIDDMTFKIFESGSVTEHVMADQTEFYEVLAEHFGISE